MSQTRTSVEATMLSCKYSDARCWSSASALRKLLCCLNTSWIWGLISGNRFTNFIYVDSRSALVMGEHRWYCKHTHTHTCTIRLSNQQVTLEYNHSWEGTNHSVTHKILCLLWIPKVHYCDHNSPPEDLIPTTAVEILIFTQHSPSVNALNYCTKTKDFKSEGN